MGLLCFPSTIFHQGCRTVGRGSISCLVGVGALPHPRIHDLEMKPPWSQRFAAGAGTRLGDTGCGDTI